MRTRMTIAASMVRMLVGFAGVLCVVNQAFGSMVIMDVWREVGTYGSTGTFAPSVGYAESFSAKESKGGVGEWSAYVSGEANVFPELGRHGGSYHARGFAETESFVGSEELETAGRVSFDGWTRMEGPYAGGASAWGEMEVTFAVTETQDYEFSAYSYMFGDSPSGQRPRAEFSFSGANTGNVLGPRDFFLNVYGGPIGFQRGIVAGHLHVSDRAFCGRRERSAGGPFGGRVGHAFESCRTRCRMRGLARCYWALVWLGCWRLGEGG